MPINLAKQEVNPGQIVYEWGVNEYEKHERGKKWYIWAALFGILLLVFALWTGNNIFALIIVLTGIILFLQDMQEPFEVSFAITDLGVIVGNNYYAYKEIDSYYIIYNSEVKSLYFTTKNLLKHRLQIPLLDYDPRPIREFLNKFVVEDIEKEEEPLTDRLTRLFKLH